MKLELPEGFEPCPMESYAGHEQMLGRLRAVVSAELFALTCDRSGHDGGDEDGVR